MSSPETKPTHTLLASVSITGPFCHVVKTLAGMNQTYSLNKDHIKKRKKDGHTRKCKLHKKNADVNHTRKN